MIASEKGGRGAQHCGRSAFLDQEVMAAAKRLLELGGAQVAHHDAVVGTARLHFITAGSGEPLVLLHGASGGSANWYRLIAPLSSRFRIIAVDLPGFGLSDAVVPAPPLGGQIAKLIHDLLRQLHLEPAVIVGTSFGGLVAARLASLSNPHHVILIDAAGLWPDASLHLKVACMPLFQRFALKQTRAGARWTLRHVLTARRLGRDHEEALIEYIHASARRTDVKNLARGYRSFGGWRGQSEVLTAEEVKAIARRTLVIWGENDRFLPAPQARRAAALAAGVQLRIIPDVGHSPNWEAPDRVLELILSFVDGKRDEEEFAGPERHAAS